MVTVSKRRYPFRRLRGPVTMWHAAAAKEPKMHLVRDCEALARTPEDRIGETRYTSAYEAANDTSTRPCRVCALPSLVITVCESASNAPVRFTVASQASPTRFDGNPLTAEYRRPSETGALRLHKLAKRLGWHLTETALGPVAVGTAEQAAVEFLGRNLRTAYLPAHKETPLDVVELFWVLASDAPPEAGGDMSFPSLWALSEATLGYRS